MARGYSSASLNSMMFGSRRRLHPVVVRDAQEMSALTALSREQLSARFWTTKNRAPLTGVLVSHVNTLEEFHAVIHDLEKADHTRFHKQFRQLREFTAEGVTDDHFLDLIRATARTFFGSFPVAEWVDTFSATQGYVLNAKPFVDAARQYTHDIGVRDLVATAYQYTPYRDEMADDLGYDIVGAIVKAMVPYLSKEEDQRVAFREAFLQGQRPGFVYGREPVRIALCCYLNQLRRGSDPLSAKQAMIKELVAA
jgi:hypothetical protein